ncbi:hypothetical protein KKA20_00850, partial [Patescibacteria group bacterium]|nr:hypothetical protein [Patescibacteria group bacterium]
IGVSEHEIDYGDNSNGWDSQTCLINEMFQKADPTPEMPGLRDDGYGYGYVRGTSAHHDTFQVGEIEECLVQYHWDKKTVCGLWEQCLTTAKKDVKAKIEEIGCY